MSDPKMRGYAYTSEPHKPASLNRGGGIPASSKRQSKPSAAIVAAKANAAAIAASSGGGGVGGVGGVGGGGGGAAASKKNRKRAAAAAAPPAPPAPPAAAGGGGAAASSGVNDARAAFEEYFVSGEAAAAPSVAPPYPGHLKFPSGGSLPAEALTHTSEFDKAMEHTYGHKFPTPKGPPSGMDHFGAYSKQGFRAAAGLPEEGAGGGGYGGGGYGGGERRPIARSFQLEDHREPSGGAGGNGSKGSKGGKGASGGSSFSINTSGMPTASRGIQLKPKAAPTRHRRTRSNRIHG